jgi:hypothetical protein
LGKAGLAPAFLFAYFFSCSSGAVACCRHHAGLQLPAQQTVDGLQAALEMSARSSYVPSSPIGVRSGFPEDARLNAASINAPGKPVWTK